MINERLGKPEFDCLTLNDVYDCGCGPEGEDGKADGIAGKAVEKIAKVKDKVVDTKQKVTDTKEKVMEKGKEVVKGVQEKAGEVGSKVQGVAAAAVAKVADAGKKVGNPIPTDKEEIVYRPKQAVEVGKKAKEAIIPKPIPPMKEEPSQAVVKPIPIELSSEDEEAEEDDSGLLDEGQEKDGAPPAEHEI